jgi:hypothetical protein
MPPVPVLTPVHPMLALVRIWVNTGSSILATITFLAMATTAVIPP